MTVESSATPGERRLVLPWFALAYGVCYLLCAALGYALSLHPGHFATFWPASGLAVGVLLCQPTRHWRYYLAAQIVANLVMDLLVLERTPAAGIGFTTANLLEALVGASLLRRLAPTGLDLSRLRDVLRLAIVSTCVSVPVGATLGSATAYLTMNARLPLAWHLWWSADLIGLLVVTPVVLGLRQARDLAREILAEPRRLAEAAGLLVGLTLTCESAFGSWLAYPAMPSLLLPFLLWAALRFGPHLGPVAVLVMALVAAEAVTHGGGPFARPDLAPAERVLVVQVFLSVCVLTFLTLAAVVAERLQAEARLQAEHVRLEQRVQERTAEVSRTNQVLQQWKDRYEAAVRASGHILYDSDRRTQQVFFSGNCTAILGYPPERLSGDQTRWTGLIHPDDLPRFDRELRHNLTTGEPFRLEYRVRHASGTYLLVYDEGASVFDEQGGLVRVVGFIRDVTEQRSLENTLRQHKERLELAQWAGRVGTFEWDIPGGQMNWADPEETPGVVGGITSYVQWRTGLHPDDRQRVEQEMARAVASQGDLRSEFRLQRPEGTIRWIAAQGKVYGDSQGTAGRMVGINIDITERKRAEEALQESEQQARLAVEAGQVGLWDYDVHSGSLRWSERHRELFGVSAEAEVTMATCFERLHPEDRDRVRKVFNRALAPGGDGLCSLEFRTRWPDGTVRWVSARGQVYFQGTGPARRAIRFLGAVIDITARKRLEDDLRSLNRRLEAQRAFTERILQRLPVGVQIADASNSLLQFSNEEAQRILQTAVDLHGRPWDEGLAGRIQAFRPDGSELPTHAWPLARTLLHGEAVKDEEIELVQADGNRVTVNVSSTPVSDGEEYRVAVAVFTEISQQKHVERELRRAEDQFHTLADSIPQLAWMARPDGAIIWYNRRWYQYTGMPPEQTEGWGWQDTHDPRELPRVLAKYRACIDSGEPWEDTFPLRRHDGQMRWHLSRAVPLRDEHGRIVRWFGTNTDITERKNAEETLRFQHELTRTITDNATTAIFLTDASGCCTFMNPAAEAMTGYSFAEVHGLPLQPLLHPDEPITVPATRPDSEGAAASTGRGDVRGHEDLFVRSDGSSFPVMCNTRPIEKAGEPVGTVIEARDITLEKEAEERIHALVNALRKAARQKDEFLATLAHELRNPLAPVRNAVEVLRMQSPDPEQLARARDMIDRQVCQMARLLDDLLDVSRITRGKLELRRERVELGSVLQTALEQSQPLIEAAGHQLTLTVPPDPVYFNADPTRLAQVFANLLNNAAKYSEPGGRIDLSAATGNGELTVTVKDSGIGIPADHLPHLFQMFSQVTAALDRSQGGLGIGLALVKGLVEMHGGQVEARSAGHGCGSTFIVRLPVAPDEAGPHAPARPPARKPRSLSRRILVVDDNRDGAASLAMMLQILGCEVSVAHDGIEALETAATFRPDIVLMDLGMPRLNGYEAGKRLRQQPGGDKLVLIALTGWGQESDRQRTREAGFNYHLVKPVDPATLQGLLDQSLDS